MEQSSSSSSSLHVRFNDGNDDQAVYNDTTFSTTINNQVSFNANDKITNTTTTTTTSRSNILSSIGPKFFQNKLNQWIQSNPAAEAKKLNPPKQMFAATATNLIFAYGRGKKARNALNDITIKVPVGTM